MSTIHPIDTREYDFVLERLRTFFRSKGFLEAYTQGVLSTLSACEDPFNLAKFDYRGDVWPMPQTGQMELERILLTNPELPGVYCNSTSYRQEPEPIEGRHDLIFPMFEFETHGDIHRLEALERELLEFMGFGPRENHPSREYDVIADLYGTDELTYIHEEYMRRDFGPTLLLKRFPEHTSPFWNMKRDGLYASKIDVIIYGIETIGSAERSVDPDEMRKRFYTISGGKYAKRLFAEFRKDRVVEELENFLSLPMIPRCGGGIGMGVTRMIHAFKRAGMLPS